MALQWSKQVFSTMATEIAWDDDLGMIVTWKNGRRSLYAGVSQEVADEVARAPSVGTALNTDIKPNYSHRYL